MTSTESTGAIHRAPARRGSLEAGRTSSRTSRTDPVADSLELARPPARLHALRLLRGDRAAAEDIVEDVIAHLWERSRVAGSSDPYPIGYVVQSVTNATINRWRRQQRHDAKRHLVGPGPLGSSSSPEEDVADARFELGQLLARLPERQRQLVSLRFLSGFTQEEVARRLGVPQGTVASGTARALQRLRALASAA